MARAAMAITAAGFRRYSTYRQATFAGTFTNTVFGFLRCYVFLAIASVSGAVAGYSGPQLATYVWLGQGMLAVVNMWTNLDLAERVRSGEVVADLLRPIDPLWTYLWTDVGRACFAVLTRFTVPLIVGALVFDLHAPASWTAYPLFAVSIALATGIGFACRYLIGLSAFWLLDVRGLAMLWAFLSTVGSGLYFPLGVLPVWLESALWIATPFPALMQGPIDIAVEGGNAGLILASQAFWVAGLLLLCRFVQARGVRKLVIQGG